MPATVQHSSFPATLDGFNAQFDALRAWLDEKEVPARPHYQIELVFEEVATNIIRYGFDDSAGETVDLTRNG